jgi:ferredoxin
VWAASANATPASGTTVATNTVSSIEYQVVQIGDASGSILGAAVGSPLRVQIGDGTDIAMVEAGSALRVNLRNTGGSEFGYGIASPLFDRISDGVDSVAVTAASELQVNVPNQVSASISNSPSVIVSSGSVVVTNALSASISNTLTASAIQGVAACPAAAWPVRLTDLTDSVAVTAASELLAFVNNSPSVVVSSGSVVVTNALSASISNTLTASAIQGVAACPAAAWPVRLTDLTDSVAVTAASELLVNVNNAASVVVSSGSVVVTNALSASISNTLTASAIQGIAACPAAAWPMRVTDLTDSVAVTAASELLAFVNNSPSVVVSSGSVVVTNALSASISNTLTASVIQSTGLGITAAWSARLTDTVDSVTVTPGSALHVNLRAATGSELGVSGSPIAQAGDMNVLWWTGSLLSVSRVNISSSVSGCTRIVASTAGNAIVVIATTFTTSGCQLIGWIASGAAAASAEVQTRMPFGTNGGMDANRMPHAFLWNFPSGSNAVITTTSACYVAGTLNYISVPS